MKWSELPFSPAPGTFVCRLDDVPDGAGYEVAFGESREPFRLLLLRRGDAVWGYHNSCPHFSLPLNYEPQRFIALDAEVVMCAHHTAFFRFDDGECVDGPCAGAHLLAVPLQMAGDGIYVGN
jgi:nitrite reductase/ring-hydroxylating ferredoxin subunit